MIEHNKPTLDELDIASATKAISSGWVAQGNMIKSFEIVILLGHEYK